MSAVCRRSPTPSTTPSRFLVRPTSRCRTTTGATGRRRRIWECLRNATSRSSFRDGALAPDHRCAIAHRGISRFRVRCFASPRNDEKDKVIFSPPSTRIARGGEGGGGGGGGGESVGAVVWRGG